MNKQLIGYCNDWYFCVTDELRLVHLAVTPASQQTVQNLSDRDPKTGFHAGRVSKSSTAFWGAAKL